MTPFRRVYASHPAIRRSYGIRGTGSDSSRRSYYDNCRCRVIDSSRVVPAVVVPAVVVVPRVVVSTVVVSTVVIPTVVVPTGVVSTVVVPTVVIYYYIFSI